MPAIDQDQFVIDTLRQDQWYKFLYIICSEGGVIVFNVEILGPINAELMIVEQGTTVWDGKISRKNEHNSMLAERLKYELCFGRLIHRCIIIQPPLSFVVQTVAHWITNRLMLIIVLCGIF